MLNKQHSLFCGLYKLGLQVMNYDKPLNCPRGSLLRLAFWLFIKTTHPTWRIAVICYPQRTNRTTNNWRHCCLFPSTTTFFFLEHIGELPSISCLLPSTTTYEPAYKLGCQTALQLISLKIIISQLIEAANTYKLAPMRQLI